MLNMPKKNKYNVGTSQKAKAARTVDGHLFMSLREAKRYSELVILQKEGKIKDLELQPRFILQCGFTDAMGVKHRELSYFADFRYIDKKTKETIVEDAKGYRTDVYKIKLKLFLYGYQNVIFRET